VFAHRTLRSTFERYIRNPGSGWPFRNADPASHSLVAGAVTLDASAVTQRPMIAKSSQAQSPSTSAESDLEQEMRADTSARN